MHNIYLLYYPDDIIRRMILHFGKVCEGFLQLCS
jgi:hypothetical protein